MGDPMAFHQCPVCKKPMKRVETEHYGHGWVFDCKCLDLVPATREDLDFVYEWRNAGDCEPGPYTPKVDAAMSRVLDSAELFLTENDAAGDAPR